MISFSAVLFDLDGTLLDTAPDLASALNVLLQEQGRDVLPYDLIRPVASNGSAGLLGLGFGITTEHHSYKRLQKRFLRLYQQNLARETQLFIGMDVVLNQLEQAHIPWGVVTNKPAFLTVPIIEQLGLAQRAACIVSGDTTAFIKPDPAPMLHASELIQIPPQQCMYIGDAQRDIQAGKNAGMKTVTALYGYLSEQDKPESWQADAMINHPTDLLEWI